MYVSKFAFYVIFSYSGQILIKGSRLYNEDFNMFIDEIQSNVEYLTLAPNEDVSNGAHPH